MTLAKNKKNSSPTIVVIGASSFVGSHVLKALENDPKIKSLVAIDCRKPSVELKKARYYKLDLTETLADVSLAEILKKEKCDTLIHCAFPMTPPRNAALAHEIISVGTMYVYNACAEAKVRKVIHSSTTDVYGAFPSNPNFLEEDRHEPKGDLQSKYLADLIDAEKQALRYSRKHPETIVTILRLATILGPTVDNYKARYLRRPIITTILGFDPLIQCLHEDDLAPAFKVTLEKDIPGIFNITGDGVLPLSRVISILGKINLRLPQIGFKTMVQLMWQMDLSPAPSSHVDFMRYLCVADGIKAKKALAFRPRFSTKEALLSFVGAERLREINLLEAAQIQE